MNYLIRKGVPVLFGFILVSSLVYFNDKKTINESNNYVNNETSNQTESYTDKEESKPSNNTNKPTNNNSSSNNNANNNNGNVTEENTNNTTNNNSNNSNTNTTNNNNNTSNTTNNSQTTNNTSNSSNTSNNTSNNNTGNNNNTGSNNGNNNSGSSTSNNNNNNNSGSNNTSNNNDEEEVPESPQSIRQRILSAYAKANSTSINNFKNQLEAEFGAEGKGYNIKENGNTWLIEILGTNYIEVMSSNGTIESYLTPEKDCGAKGNGTSDDTNAIKSCLESSTKNIVLRGTYLISSNIETSKEKNIFGGKFLVQVQNGTRALVFKNIIRMNGTSFTSNIKRTGTSPHGETFTSTSNIDFVEVWGKEARFVNCSFKNALRAIRGRISTGATVVPETLYVNDCDFIDDKAPIQGYFANTTVDNTNFKNSGDLYSGDHAIYLEASSTKTLTVKNSKVETNNTESGAAFQTYGKKSNQSTPKIKITNTTINANGIVSSDLADVTITKTNFTAQHTNRYVITVESGSVVIDDSKITHNLFLAKYPNTSVIAKDSVFKLNKVSGASRAFFPKESTNCKFINWGGYVLYPTTKITNSTFTRDAEHVVGNYYIGSYEGSTLYIEGSKFKASDNIAYNSLGTISIKNSYFTNNIGTNVPNVILEGNTHSDIVD